MAGRSLTSYARIAAPFVPPDGPDSRGLRVESRFVEAARVTPRCRRAAEDALVAGRLEGIISFMVLSETLGLCSRPHMDRYSKKRNPVDVKIAEQDGIMTTLEGPVSFHAGDALLTGVNGERWPVGKERFERTYKAVPPTAPGTSGCYVRLPNEVRARQMDKDFSVKTGNGDTLHGKAGDWLLEYGPGDWGIVADEIFAQTYHPIRG